MAQTVDCATPEYRWTKTLRWCHNGRDGVSNHQSHHCLLERLFKRRSKKTSKFRVIGLCAGNSSVTGEIPAQMASNADYCFHYVTSSWVSRFQVNWSATLAHKSPHVANAKVNGSSNSTQPIVLDKIIISSTQKSNGNIVKSKCKLTLFPIHIITWWTLCTSYLKRHICIYIYIYIYALIHQM